MCERARGRRRRRRRGQGQERDKETGQQGQTKQSRGVTLLCFVCQVLSLCPIALFCHQHPPPPCVSSLLLLGGPLLMCVTNVPVPQFPLLFSPPTLPTPSLTDVCSQFLDALLVLSSSGFSLFLFFCCFFSAGKPHLPKAHLQGN